MSVYFLRSQCRRLCTADSGATAPPVVKRSNSRSPHSSSIFQRGKRKRSSSQQSQHTVMKRRKRERPDTSEDFTSEEQEKSSTVTDQRAALEQKYLHIFRLGDGGYGSVFAGCRRADFAPVAIKHIPKNKVIYTIVMEDGEVKEVPVEVLLLQMVAGAKADDEDDDDDQSVTAELLDSYELQEELVLVLERPVPCKDLFDYIQERGQLEESQAKLIFRQLVKAVMAIQAEGVLHRDLKPENILVQSSSEDPHIWVVDFGCGCLLKEGVYTKFCGTAQYAPPEWYLDGVYQAEQMTVWQVGVVLYDMLCGESPFRNSTQIMTEEPFIPPHLSLQCEDLLRRCLDKEAADRPSLHTILQHCWLQSPEQHSSPHTC